MKCDYRDDFINTPTAIATLLNDLAKLPTSPPSLYIDLEGIDISRSGEISILQLLVGPTGKTHLLDVHTLKDLVFHTPGSDGRTLRDILEDAAIPKVFFDIRSNSDALSALFHINVAGIVDLQLMELATRRCVGNNGRRFVASLEKCINSDLTLTASQKVARQATREKGMQLFAPEHGGSCEVFKTRPLPEDLIAYCLQEVQHMPLLYEKYKNKISMTVEWERKVEHATRARVALSQSVTFNGKGQHMSLAPSGW